MTEFWTNKCSKMTEFWTNL